MISLGIQAQVTAKRIGLPFITNHPKSEYLGKLVIEEMEIDSKGMVFLAADENIFRFDGETFEAIPLTNYKGISSIEIIGDRIYFIAAKGFGYVRLKTGGQEVVSFVDEFEELESYKGGTRVFEKDGRLYYYFQYHTVIYNPEDNSIIHQEHEEKLQSAVKFEGDIFLQKAIDKIYRVNGDTIELDFKFYDNGERQVSTLTGIFRVKDEVYYSLRYNGLFTRDGDGIKRVNNDISNDLQTKQGYSVTKLNEDLIASVCIDEGLILYDKNMKKIKTISINDGILNKITFSMALTKKGDLLLGTIAGVSILHLGAPVSTLDDKQGLPTKPVLGFASELIHNRFYFVVGSTIWGVDCEGEFEGRVQSYYTVPDVNLIGAFLRAENNLLYFSEPISGIYSLDEEGKVENVSKVSTDMLLLVSEANIVILQGDAILNVNPKTDDVDTLVDFKKEGITVNKSVDIIENESLQSVFLGDINGQFYHLQMSPDLKKKKFFEKIGKPIKNMKSFQASANGMIFSNADFISSYNIKDKKFYINQELSELYKSYEIRPEFLTDKNFNLWLTHPEKGTTKFILDAEGKYREDPYSKEIRKIGKEEWGILPASEKHIFFLAPKGLFHINYQKVNPDNWEFKPYFKSINSALGDTSYFSYLTVSDHKVSYAPGNSNIFDFENNDLRINYGSVYFGKHSDIEYRIRIVGYQDEWSKWSNEKFKEIINIQEGTYTVELQARDFYRVPSRVVSFSFTVLPPWYRTIWAYIAYVIFGGGFVYLIVYLNSRRLLKQKKELESIVEERTHEIRLQNETLQQQTEEIQTQAEDLEFSNRQLEKRNVQITDSINYARKIQKARLLPMRSKLIEKCDNSFVLFEPKDIVSGDFYWYHEGDKYEYICAADCTGHGVPGAFMSILGVDTLEKIIHKGFVEPHHILEELSNEIHTLLRKNNAGVKDGMDLTIVAISKDKSVARIAGVENPVYLIRNGEMIQFKTDKSPIGNEHGQKYNVQDVQLETGDIFYQFTDGFADQKGGPKNKKFFYPPFRKLLVELSTENFAHQERSLKQTFTDWKGENEQYDDVCIIGYKIS